MKPFEIMVNAAPVALLVADQTGRITFANTAAARLFGYASGELVGQPIEILVPAGRRAEHVGKRDGYIAQPSARPMGLGRDLYGQRKDGTQFFVEIGLSPVDTPEGPCVLAAVFDITERKRLQTRMEAANQELEAFTYSVSHDLRAPLRAIDGFLGVLGKDHGERLDAEGRRMLNIVRQNAVKMGRLIDDLLEFSRLGRKALTVRTVDMKKLAESVLSEIQAAGPERRWEVRVDRLPEANGDEALFRQVWVNLLGNAAKYTGGRATAIVEVGSRQEHGERIYYVKDNGVGFDMRYAGKLFQVFQRLHKASEFEGTGIGLALVQRIVSRHGGRVWAEGSPGQGATFFFALPERKDPDAENA